MDFLVVLTMAMDFRVLSSLSNSLDMDFRVPSSLSNSLDMDFRVLSSLSNFRVPSSLSNSLDIQFCPCRQRKRLYVNDVYRIHKYTFIESIHRL
jgi:hypothetical protein